MPTTITNTFGPSMFTCATEAELLDFANQIRKAGGANAIDALLPSTPGDARTCLIANALNFSCQVSYGRKPNGDDFELDNDMKPWFMRFPSNMTEERKQEIATAMGLELVEILIIAGAYYGEATEMAMRLPQEIGNAAYAFDVGLAFQDFAKSYDHE